MIIKKILLIILLFPLIIFFLACVNCNNAEDIYTANSIEELGILLHKLPENTADKPYTILLNVNDLTGISYLIKNNYKKYIVLDLSDSTITSIDDYAFAGCPNLTGIVIPGSVINIGDCAFNGCGSLESVIIPDSIINIGVRAFSVCYKLESITIPRGITIINNGVFESCISLTSINIPNNITGIEDFAFAGCTNLSDLTIPDSVIYIGKWAFAGCRSLPGITIPKSVTGIGEMAFYSCYNFISVKIPDSVNYIGDMVFDDCKNLSAIDVDENNFKYSSTDGILYNKDKTILLSYPQGKTNSTFIIPNSVTTIEYAAFVRCYNLTGVIVPTNVNNIGDFAFANCDNLTSVIFQGTIPSADFSYKDPLPGDLRDKFYEDDADNGTPGTYTRENSGTTWVRQP